MYVFSIESCLDQILKTCYNIYVPLKENLTLSSETLLSDILLCGLCFVIF